MSESSSISIASSLASSPSPSIRPNTETPTSTSAPAKQEGRKREGTDRRNARTIDGPVGPINRDEPNEDAARQGEVGDWSLEAIGQHGVVPPGVLATEGEARHGWLCVCGGVCGEGGKGGERERR